MKASPNIKVKNLGFSLVELMMSVSVMSLVITGGLIAIGQATLLSEKSGEQMQADFILRQEVEAIRNLDWSEISSLETAALAYERANSGKSYAALQAYSAADLADLGFSASVTAKEIDSSAKTGKKIIKVTLAWTDVAGNQHEESRITVVSEGGLSAST